MTAKELRKLDAEVAEHVMGWKRGKRYGNGNGEWIIAGEEKKTFYTTWDQTPSFSTDIRAAWQVVEKMRGRVMMEVQFELFANEDGSWDAVFGIDGEGTGKSAPLAICRAALKCCAVKKNHA